MPRYKIKSNVAFNGLDTIVIDSPDQHAVGDSVTLSPTAPMTVENGSGGSVTLQPGVSFTGIVLSKD